MDSHTNMSEFAARQLELLEAEQAAETAQSAALLASVAPSTLANAGLAILNLVMVAQRTGLGGKTVIELETDSAIKGQSSGHVEHGLRVGDIVRVGEQPRGGEKKKDKMDMETRGAEGVVTRVPAVGLEVALNEGTGEDQNLAGRLWVVKLANDVTYKRMHHTMRQLRDWKPQEQTTLSRILLGMEKPYMAKALDWTVNYLDSSLNESQRSAVDFALRAKHIALIHGPPGTGKTHTLIELIRQLVHEKKRVLVCGPSNISVDNIVERLAIHKLPILRIGHPARLLSSVLDHSLAVLTRTSDAAGIIKDVRADMDAKQASIKKTRSGRERRVIYGELKELRKEYREREKQCIVNLVRQSSVILATLHGAGSFQLRDEKFDVVIIDEASQALEAQCWIPIMSAKKVILAGDHMQLPPTVKSVTSPPSSSENKITSKLSKLTLEETMFSRALNLYGEEIKTMLTVQYRMHQDICAFPSKELYQSRLVAAGSVAARVLSELPYPVDHTDDTSVPLVFYDTQGGDFPEDMAGDTSESHDAVGSSKGKALRLADSKSNSGEARLVKKHVLALLNAGVHEGDIAVITPYNAQVSLLARMMKHEHPQIELGSVDGFQGREKEVVILSLVRSNLEVTKGGMDAEVGFLGEKRRLNVAMTRPRRHLCVIGDSETIGRGSAFLKCWMQYLETVADLRYPDLSELND